jgi:hypothetical protein
MTGHETEEVILLIERNSTIYDTCKFHGSEILKQTLHVDLMDSGR